MKRTQSFLFSLILLALFPSAALAQQLWSSVITDPTRAVDWSTAGVPGGIPSGSWMQSGSTILAATYGNGSSDAASGIQTALNACGTNHYVLLGPGVFRINTHLVIPNNCVLRGSGANNTQLSDMGTSDALILFGNSAMTGVQVPINSSTTFTGGSQGATTITVASASGISTGNLLMLSQPNLSYMTEVGAPGGSDCNFCYSGLANDSLSGQVVRVTNVAGTTLTIDPPLYIAYASPSYAFRYNASGYSPVTNSGLEDLKVTQNNTHSHSSNIATIQMTGAYASWVKGVESTFSDNAHMYLYYSTHCEIRNSFFHDAYVHGPGATDEQVNLAYKTSASLIINNIFWRMHVGLMTERGPSGDVIAYNYAVGNYDDNSPQWQEPGMDAHGAHPMMLLWEGNVTNFMLFDDYWGSNSHYTLFRNYVSGSNQNVPPHNTPGALQLSSAVWEDNGNDFAIDINSESQYFNVVGDILGSPHGTSQGYVDSKVNPASGSGNNVCFRIGYNGSNDNTVAGTLPYTTAFIHGLYGCQSGTFTWASGVTHTLPASFFLSGKPNWWGSQPWPPIGPDVAGGNIAGVGGYANSIPAMDCFNSVTSNGTSNVTTFNEATCYGGGGSAAEPNPPTGLSALVQVQ